MSTVMYLMPALNSNTSIHKRQSLLLSSRVNREFATPHHKYNYTTLELITQNVCRLVSSMPRLRSFVHLKFKKICSHLVDDGNLIIFNENWIRTCTKFNNCESVCDYGVCNNMQYECVWRVWSVEAQHTASSSNR